MLTFLVTLIAAGCGAYFGTYLREKGKNLATKEDLADLTRIVEEIKNEHAKELEQVKARQQLRMAALDKRLQAHQEAFALWRRLYTGVHTDEVNEIVIECDKWWTANCLYLEPDARQAFSDAYWFGRHHKLYLESPKRDESTITLIQNNWERIEKAGNVILTAIELPGLSAGEWERLKDDVAASSEVAQCGLTHANGNSKRDEKS